MAKRPENTTRSGTFEAPTAAVHLRTPGAWVAFTCIMAAGGLAALTFRGPALWPTADPVFTIAALAVAATIANMFGAFQTVEGLAEYTSLSMPIGFAMFLLLDWRSFLIAIALTEALTFASERLRNVHPTIWYIRIFNVFTQIVCGAAAAAVLLAFHASGDLVAGGPFDLEIAVVIILASFVWKVLDSVQSAVLITLGTGLPLASVRMPPRPFFAQFALFLIAIPLARLWYENVWLSTFALAPLAVAYRILRLPELEHRLRTDERTGLRNAFAFDRALEVGLDEARDTGRGAALLAIDIDHFKDVNDTFGHLAGDTVIARFADVLAELKRADDVAARTGGEEFAILIGDGSREAAVAVAERIRAHVAREPFRCDDDVVVRITTSIGVAVFPSDARGPRDLRKAADDALYAAKRDGRNLVRTALSLVQPQLPLDDLAPSSARRTPSG